MVGEVIISNPERFERVKGAIVKGGVDRFHIVADFDRTLTRAFYEDKRASSIISYLRKEKGKYLTDDYAERAQELFDKYHPIEISSEISQEEKTKKMYEWWKAHKGLLIECGFDKDLVKRAVRDMVEENALCFREGVEEFFKFLKDNNIPLIIMSSSLGDLIEEFLRQKGLLSENFFVVANSFEFDERGKAVKIERIIHVLNKHEMEIEGLEIYDELLNRRNVLLLGDSLGDLGMIEGFNFENLIKVGFLNGSEGDLESYKEGYDVVIVGSENKEGDFGFVNELVGEII